MTRHEMRECIFCLMFQNDFYGTDEFEEQMSNFLANFHFPEEHEISEKDEKEVREKVANCKSGISNFETGCL